MPETPYPASFESISSNQAMVEAAEPATNAYTEAAFNLAIEHIDPWKLMQNQRHIEHINPASS